MSCRKTGILGGTFNPIHNAHLQLAQEALEYENLDRILFIPAGNPNFKKDQSIADNGIRRKMTSAAIRGNPFFELEDYELKKEGYSYTAETLDYLKQKYPNDLFYFILGEDSAASLPHWHRTEDLKGSVTFLAGRRSGEETDFVNNLQKDGYIIKEIPFMYLEISSTVIRKKVFEGKEIRYLVPEGVRRIIEDEGLYKNNG